MPQKKRTTKAQLEREVKELKAQLAGTLHFASVGLKSASVSCMLGGGVILELTGLGGRELIPPVCIYDGLSDETLEALQEDFRRSYEHATEFRPLESP